MPIYEYQCQACGAEKEVLQRMSDDPLKDCDQCGQPTLKKKISAAGFRLSGSGWYETDFKTGNKKNLVSNKSTDGASSGSKSGSDSKKSETTSSSST